MSTDPNIMGWDDVVESDGQDFVVLPEGDYLYTVVNLERGQFPGGPKIPPCPKATVTLNIDNDEGLAIARVDLMLYRSVEWKIAAFFRSIGQKKHGESVTMNWNEVIGRRGKARFRPRRYTGRDGMEHQVNDVERFLDYRPEEHMTEVEAAEAELPWGNSGDDSGNESEGNGGNGGIGR